MDDDTHDTDTGTKHPFQVSLEMVSSSIEKVNTDILSRYIENDGSVRTRRITIHGTAMHVPLLMLTPPSMFVLQEFSVTPSAVDHPVVRLGRLGDDTINTTFLAACNQIRSEDVLPP